MAYGARDDAYVNHIPVLTGGSGKPELHQFYATHFIPKMPPDLAMTPLSRTIGSEGRRRHGQAPAAR